MYTYIQTYGEHTCTCMHMHVCNMTRTVRATSACPEMSSFENASLYASVLAPKISRRLSTEFARNS